MCASLLYEGQQSRSEGGSLLASGNGKSASNAALLAAALNALSASVAIIDARGLIVGINDAWRRHADENGLRWARYGIGYNYLSVLDSAAQDDPDIAEIASGVRAVLAGTAAACRVEYACQAPSSCQFLQQVTAFEFAGGRHALISHENITLQKLNEAELRAAREAAEAAHRAAESSRAAVEEHLRSAEAAADVLRIASSPAPIEDALQGIVERVRENRRCDAVAIFSAEERWDRLVLVAASGPFPAAGRRGEYAIQPAMLAQALGHQWATRIGDKRTYKSRGKPAYAEGQQNGGGLLVSPVQWKDRFFGYLVFYYAEPREFAAEDIELGHQFAQQASLALENAELRSQAERVAVENERSRLARELHDAVTQTLFSASVVAEALPRVWERDPAEGKRALEDLRLWTRGALAEMRTLLMELRPAALIEKPLADLIRQLGEATATRLLIPVKCQVAAEVEPPPDVKLALYRIAQEALTNITKHAHASQVAVRYEAQPGGVRLTIVDDGRGFELEKRPPGQMGLGIMFERVERLGGRLLVRTAPGAGTAVEVEWRPQPGRVSHES